jgi:hypothetical protein
MDSLPGMYQVKACMVSSVPLHERLYSNIEIDLGTLVTAMTSPMGAVAPASGMCAVAAAKEGQVGHNLGERARAKYEGS